MCDVAVVFTWLSMVRTDWCGDSTTSIKPGWLLVSIWISEKTGILIEHDPIFIEGSNVRVFCIMFFNLDITEILLTYTEEMCGMFFYEFSNCSSMKKKITSERTKCANNSK